MAAIRGAMAVAVVLSAATCDGGDDAATRRADTGSTGTPAFPDTPLPDARTEVAGAFWGDRIAVAGGFTGDGTPSDRLDLLDESGEWSSGPDLPFLYDHSSLAVLNGRLWLVGGYVTDPENGSVDPVDFVYSLGPGEDRWKAEPPMREARGALATVAVAGMLVAIGGANDTGVLGTTELMDGETREWRSGPALATPREHAAAAVVGDTVYAIAGRQLSLETNLTSVESLKLPDGEWQPEPDLNFSRGGTAAAGLREQPCVAGGEEPGGTIPSVECLVSGAWKQVATLEVPRHGLALVAIGNDLHVIGGGPQPGLFVSDAHEVLEV